MSYLLDTCTISEMVKPRPAPSVIAWIERADELSLHLSVVTLGELHRGIAKLPEGRRKRRLQAWVEEDLGVRFDGRILPLTPAIAARWGRIAGDADRRGAPLPVIDGMIAATAIVHGVTVVTRDTGPIRRAGAAVVDPWEPWEVGSGTP